MEIDRGCRVILCVFECCGTDAGSRPGLGWGWEDIEYARMLCMLEGRIRRE